MSTKFDAGTVEALLTLAGETLPADRLDQHVPWLRYIAAAGRRLAGAGLGHAAPWQGQGDA
jgi:hypothetical protein